VITWGELRAARPDLASAGRELLYRFDVGLGLLATVRSDGGPRVHPMCPLLTDNGLYAFIVPSPKCDDLRRDGRYALHCYPPPDNEDAFYVTGRATLVDDGSLRTSLSDQFVAERTQFSVPPPGDDPEQTLFELLISSALVTRTTGHGDPAPRHEVWRVS
jgi:hypothetical protein